MTTAPRDKSATQAPWARAPTQAPWPSAMSTPGPWGGTLTQAPWSTLGRASAPSHVSLAPPPLLSTSSVLSHPSSPMESDRPGPAHNLRDSSTGPTPLPESPKERTPL